MGLDSSDHGDAGERGVHGVDSCRYPRLRSEFKSTASTALPQHSNFCRRFCAPAVAKLAFFLVKE
jgi:hypothetical protein